MVIINNFLASETLVTNASKARVPPPPYLQPVGTLAWAGCQASRDAHPRYLRIQRSEHYTQTRDKFTAFFKQEIARARRDGTTKREIARGRHVYIEPPDLQGKMPQAGQKGKGRERERTLGTNQSVHSALITAYSYNSYSTRIPTRLNRRTPLPRVARAHGLPLRRRPGGGRLPTTAAR